MHGAKMAPSAQALCSFVGNIIGYEGFPVSDCRHGEAL